MNHSVDRARITLPLGVSRGTVYSQCVSVYVRYKYSAALFIFPLHTTFVVRETRELCNRIVRKQV